jgi:hypothetical protein
MKWDKRLVIIGTVLLLMTSGIAAADHISVWWDEEPRAEVAPGETIEVESYVATSKETDVRLRQSRSFNLDRTLDTRTVYSSGTVALETNPDELGLDPGDSADLYIEAEEPGYFSHSDTVSARTVEVNDDPPRITSWWTEMDSREVVVTARVSEGVGPIDSVEVNWDSGSSLNPWSGKSAEMEYQGGNTYQLAIPTSGTFDWEENVEIGIEAIGEYGTSTETGVTTVQTDSNDPPAITAVDTDVDDREIKLTAEVSEGTGSVTSVYANYDAGSAFNPWSGEAVEMSSVGGNTYEATIPASGTFGWDEDVEVGVIANDEYGSTSEQDVGTVTTNPNRPPSIDSVTTDIDDRQITVTATVSEGTGSITDASVNWDSGSILNPWSGESAEMEYMGSGTYQYTIPTSGSFDWGEDVKLGVEANDEYGSSDTSGTTTESIPDDTTPPSISSIETSYDGTEVTVTAAVSDERSGVDAIDLHYNTGWTDVFGTTVPMESTDGNTYEATFEIGYGERFSFDVSASDANGNQQSTDSFERQVPRGTATVQVHNNDDEAKDIRILVDDSQVDTLSVPAGATRSQDVTADPGSRRIEIEYDEVDRDGETFTESTTASIPQDASQTVDLSIPERLAPKLSVSCEACQLGRYDYNDPPAVRIDVTNDGGGDLEWRVPSGPFDIIDQGDDYVIVEPISQGEFEEDLTIGILNGRYEGDPTQSVTVSGEALIEATPPDVSWSQLPPDDVTAGDGATALVTGEAGSSGTSGTADPAPAEELEFVWYIDDEEVARTTDPEPRDIGAAASTELTFEEPGEHEVYVEAIDPNTGKSSTTENKTVTVDEPSGKIVGYQNPAEGDVYELDTWYDVETVIKNTGNVRQTYEIEAETPTGIEVQEKTKRVTLDPDEERAVTFEQRFYGVNTATRAFSHELYTVQFSDDERVSIDTSNVTMVQPDVGKLNVDFVDERGNDVEPDFEIYDETNELVKDGRGDKVYQFFEAGDYTISAGADGHHNTFQRFTLEKNTELNLTVVVPSDDADATVDDVVLVDETTAYERGDTVTVEATVQNTGDVEHEFFVGFSVLNSDGDVYDNDRTTGQRVTLAPGETQEVILEWNVEDVASDGTYDVIVSTWWESDRNELQTALDTMTVESAFSVGTDTSFDATLETGRTTAATGSKVALGVTGAPENAQIDWSIEQAPESDAGELLHDTGTDTSLTVNAEGTYTVTAVIKDDGDTEVLKRNIQVESKKVESLDTTAEELTEEYAPILNFHPDERFFPTRYEAYVENSVVATQSSEMSNPSLLDLERGSEQIDPQTTDDEELLQFQDFETYGETVYSGVHENVSYKGEEYVGVSYWFFYVNDPKPSDSGFVHKRAKHTGDQEKVLLLMNESGPQWIAAAQHFGGEIRRWEKVNKSENRPILFAGEGSHPTFFEPYGGTVQSEALEPVPTGYEYQKLYQEQYLTELFNLEFEPGSTEPHPLIYANQYTDPVSGDGPTWGPTTDSDMREYETILLTEEMAWANYEGKVYTYPEAPSKGSVPMQSTVWTDTETWLTEEIAPSHEQFDGEISSPEQGQQPDITRVDGTMMTNLTVANTGPQSGMFVLNVTAEHESGTVYSAEYGQPIDANTIADGEYQAEEKGVSVPVFPDDVEQISSGEWDVTVELASYSADIRDEEDIHDDMTFSFAHEAEVDADVKFTETATGEVTPSDTVTSNVTVENTGETEHQYFVGYSAVGPDGEFYDQDDSTGQTVSVAPGSSTEVTLEWTVSESLPEGEYDLVTAVWLESDRNSLTTQLDSARADNSVTVADTDVGQVTITSQPPGATVTVDDREISQLAPVAVTLEGGTHEITVDAEGYEPTTKTIDVDPGTETVHSFELTRVQGEPTAAIEADTGDVTTNDRIEFDASGSTDPQVSELTYEWDLDGDGQYDDATGAGIVHQFDEAGTYTVSVRVSNDVGTDVASTTVTVDVSGPEYNVETAVPADTDLKINDTITTTTVIENVGDQAGSVDVELSIDGEVRDVQTLDVSPGDDATAELTATLKQTGERSIDVIASTDGETLDETSHTVTVGSTEDSISAESISVDDPSTDDSAAAESSEQIPIVGTITYSDSVSREDTQQILENADIEVTIGSKQAAVDELEARTFLCPAVVGSDCPQQAKFELTITVPSLENGTYDLELTATVPEGESFSETQTLQTTVTDGVQVGDTGDGENGTDEGGAENDDTQWNGPTIEIETPASTGPVNTSAVNIGYSVSNADGANADAVEYRVDDGEWQSAAFDQAAQERNFTTELPSLADGNHTVELRMLAENGSELPAASSRDNISFTVDTTPPAVSLANHDRDTPVQYTDETTLTLLVDEQHEIEEVTYHVDQETPQSLSEPYEIDVSEEGWDEGQTELTVSATDSAGNAHTETIPLELVSEPTVSVVEPAEGALLNTTTPTVQVAYTDDAVSGDTDIDPEAITLSVDGTPVDLTAAEVTDEKLELTLPESAIGRPDADSSEHTVSVTVVDNAGYETTKQRTITVDTQAPTVDLAVIPADSSFPRISPDNPARITTSTDDTRLDTAELEIRDSQDTIVYEQDITSESAEGTLAERSWRALNPAQEPVPSGEYTVVVRSIDAAGNVNTTRKPISVDTAEPNIQVVDVSGGSQETGTIQTNNSISVTVEADDRLGESDDVETVELELNADFTTYRFIAEATRVDGEDNRWETTLDAGTLPDEGSYTVRAIAVDSAKNTNSSVSDETVTYDGTPPELGAVLDLNETTEEGTLTIRSNEPLQGVPEVRLESDESAGPVSVEPSAGNTWTDTFELNGSGTYTVLTNGTDQAGNVGSDSMVSTVEVVNTTNGTATVLNEDTGTFIVFKTDSPVENSFVTVSENDLPPQELTDDRHGIRFLTSELGAELDTNLTNATIHMPVASEELPEGTEPEDVHITYYNETLDQWVDRETTVEEVDQQFSESGDKITLSGTYLTTTVDGFSTYGTTISDETPPQLVYSSPESGTVTGDRETVTATFEYEDVLSEVNVSAIKVFVDDGTGDTPVTDASRTTITSSKTNHTLDVSPGKTYDVHLEVPDNAGNIAEFDTTIQVADSTAPSITDSFVPDGETLEAGTETVDVRFDYETDGPAIDTSASALHIDGTPVDVEFDSGTVTHNLNVETGSQYTATLVLVDEQSNTDERSITFQIAEPDDTNDGSTDGQGDDGAAGGGGGGGGGSLGGAESVDIEILEFDSETTIRVSSIPPSGETEITTDDVVVGDTLTLESIRADFKFEPSDFRFEVADPTAGPSGMPAVDSDAGKPVGYVDFNIIGTEQRYIAEMDVEIAAHDDALPEDVMMDDIVVHQQVDGEWIALDTTTVDGKVVASLETYSDGALAVTANTEPTDESPSGQSNEESSTGEESEVELNSTDEASEDEINSESNATGTKDSSESSSQDGDDSTSTSVPGFGIPVSILALLMTASLMGRRS